MPKATAEVEEGLPRTRRAAAVEVVTAAVLACSAMAEVVVLLSNRAWVVAKVL